MFAIERYGIMRLYRKRHNGIHAEVKIMPS
jgi:hypothetical protein